MDKLKEYSGKRTFDNTPEPDGTIIESEEKNRFVVQKHDARREHYDLRLQVGDVLVSWAIPKQPVDDPEIKRLAIKVDIILSAISILKEPFLRAITVPERLWYGISAIDYINDSKNFPTVEAM